MSNALQFLVFTAAAWLNRQQGDAKRHKRIGGLLNYYSRQAA